MNRLLSVFVLTMTLVACKSKKDKKPDVPASSFFPVPAFIRGEVARLDTSLHSFYKIEMVNGRTDTIAIKNSEVKVYAKDFLALPDLAAPELKDDYTVTQLYDDMQEAFVFTFTTNSSHPVKQEDVTVDPQQNAAGKNDIRSIYANVIQNDKGILQQKRLLWEVGKSFTTTTITRPTNSEEQIKKVQIVWNDFANPQPEKKGK